MKFDKYEKLGAYHYQWYEDPNWAWYKECVDRVVGFCQGVTFDLGCGDGLVCSKIEKNGFRTKGFDNNEIALSFCKTPVEYWDFENTDGVIMFGDFDYVCCLNTIEHLKTPEIILRTIKFARKGAIIITDKATEHKGRYHEHEYTREELIETFKEFKPKYFEINSTEFGKPITFIGVEIKK